MTKVREHTIETQQLATSGQPGILDNSAVQVTIDQNTVQHMTSPGHETCMAIISDIPQHYHKLGFHWMIRNIVTSLGCTG